ncbi:MAG: GIN domain-containing protein [Ruminococcus sp.]
MIKKEKFKIFAFLTAFIMICEMTACGKNYDDLDADLTIKMAETFEPIIGSGNLSSKNIDISDGSYQFSTRDINATDSTITVDIVSAGNGGIVEVDDNVIDDFSLDIDYNNKTITLTANPEETYKNINCKVTLNALVNSVEVDGITKVNYTVPEDSETVTISASGTSSVTASGSCVNAEYQASGGANVDTSQLQVNDVNVNASGAAQVLVNTNGKLIIDASGASSVYYSGNPESIEDNVAGTAKIVKN